MRARCGKTHNSLRQRLGIDGFSHARVNLPSRYNVAGSPALSKSEETHQAQPDNPHQLPFQSCLHEKTMPTPPCG